MTSDSSVLGAWAVPTFQTTLSRPTYTLGDPFSVQKNSHCPFCAVRSPQTSGLFQGDYTVPGEQSFPFCLGKHDI